MLPNLRTLLPSRIVLHGRVLRSLRHRRHHEEGDEEPTGGWHCRVLDGVILFLQKMSNYFRVPVVRDVFLLCSCFTFLQDQGQKSSGGSPKCDPSRKKKGERGRAGGRICSCYNMIFRTCLLLANRHLADEKRFAGRNLLGNKADPRRWTRMGRRLASKPSPSSSFLLLFFFF